MNERVKEFAVQADLYARSDNSSMLFENYQKRYTEKFAELIIRECAEVMDKDMDHPYVSRGSILKHHFGVEQ